MTDMARTVVDLTGWIGGPGVCVFHWCAPAHVAIAEAAVDQFHEDLADALVLCNTGLINQATWTIRPTVDVVEDSTGELIYAKTQTTATYTGTGSGSGTSLSRSSMVGIKWGTADIVNGRRVQGRTFWGPADDAVFTTTGQIAPAVLANWPGYFSACTDNIGPRMVVWHRPTGPSATDGQYCDVTNVSIGTKPFELRSRRD